MAEPIQIGEGPDRNRRVIVLAAVAAVLLLAVVVLPGLLVDDSGPPTDPFPGVDQGSTATSAPAEPPPAETFEVFSNTNPFRPLVATAAPVDAPAGESTPVIEIDEDTPTPTFPPFSEDDGSVTFPEDDGGFEPPPPDTSTTTGPPPPPARQPDRVGLLEVFTDAGGQVVASVRVNDVTHQVAEGDVFARSYRVIDLDISSRCGTFLFGDDRFGLCEGDEVLK